MENLHEIRGLLLSRAKAEEAAAEMFVRDLGEFSRDVIKREYAAVVLREMAALIGDE